MSSVLCLRLFKLQNGNNVALNANNFIYALKAENFTMSVNYSPATHINPSVR